MKATDQIVDGSIRVYTGPTGLTAGTMVVQGASDGVIALPSGANQQIIGVITDTDLVGNGTYGVKRTGEAYIICGAALTAPGYFKSDTNGHAIPTTATADYIVGSAVTSTASSGDEFIGLLTPFIR